MKTKTNKIKKEKEYFNIFISAILTLGSSLIVAIITGLYFTSPMNNYNQNQSPLVISNPRIIKSHLQNKKIDFLDLESRGETRTFENSSIVFTINSGKIIDSKWYYIDKSTWDKYYELQKSESELNNKGKIVNALPFLKQTSITPVTQKDKVQEYSGMWYLNKYDRSVGATKDGYYFLLLTSAKGEKYLYGVTITALTFSTKSNKNDIPIKKLPKKNFEISLIDEDEVASSIQDPKKMSTGSGMRRMIFINMYQNLKNKLQEEIGAVH